MTTMSAGPSSPAGPMRPGAAVSRNTTAQQVALQAGEYWRLSRQPLHSLWFLLPLIVTYEFAAFAYTFDPKTGLISSIWAATVLRQCFEWLGITAYGLALPGVFVVAVLGAWHLVRKDPLSFRPRLYFLMAAESAVMALPLVALMLLFMHQTVPQMATSGAGPSSWQAQLTLSLGAGIYEELVFRLILIAMLHMVLVDAFSMPHRWGATLAVAISSAAFALYHFSEQNPFTLMRFAFYTAAGVYFACLYLRRGFGIAVGAHATYDVIVVVMMLAQGARGI